MTDTSLPAACPLCRGTYTLGTDGRLPSHRLGGYLVRPFCPGSGHQPIEQPAQPGRAAHTPDLATPAVPWLP